MRIGYSFQFLYSVVSNLINLEHKPDFIRIESSINDEFNYSETAYFVIFSFVQELDVFTRNEYKIILSIACNFVKKKKEQLMVCVFRKLLLTHDTILLQLGTSSKQMY